jgi:hypothetical protein
MFAGPVAISADEVAPDKKASSLAWYHDYAEAQRAARLSEQMLIVVFHDPRYPDVYNDYLATLENNEKIVAAAENFVLCKLPIDFEVVTPPADGSEATEHARTKLLSHPAFAEMQERAGVVFIDYAHTKSKFYGHVVNVFPFKSRFLAPERLLVMMNLPEGSLTQRTMIYAVMTHPEKPASVYGKFDPTLAQETESHSHYQANIRVQGHHRWESRFHRINALLGRGLTSQEVVAESWPGQDLVEAAEECVHSWRQSSGHWSAVRARHAVFGYDIKRGANGIWYATGIFGRH